MKTSHEFLAPIEFLFMIAHKKAARYFPQMPTQV